MTAPSPQQARPGTLEDLLAMRGPLPADEVLALFRPLPGQVRALHDARRLHAAIRPGNVLLDGGGPRLAEPPATLDLDGDPQTCPPELAGLGPLPAGAIEEVAAALKQRGVAADPRRIDAYQLAALLVRLCTGGSVARFRRSPLAGATMPASWRPVIDRALASSHGGPEDAGQLLADLEAIGIQPQPPLESPVTASWRSSSADTPAEGEPGLPFDRLGPYRLVALLGRGGMGDVYLGLEDGTARPAAVKVLRPALARNPALVRRFQNEAGALARLDHPNLVPIHSVGEDRGAHFFAMQYVRGESLEQRLQRRGKLTSGEALDVLEGCLSGLAAAHETGLVHRDVKPSNVLLEEGSGRVRMADFGLVKDLEAGHALTSTGAVMGTLGYLAPEQARGERVDGRADLYSLGVVAYRMLSGRLPFEADSLPATLLQQAYAEPPPLVEVEPGLARLVGGLMARRKTDRYASCSEALADLARLRRGEPMAGPSPAPPVRLVRLPELDPLPEVPPMPPRPAWPARLGAWLGLLPAREAESLDTITQQVDALAERCQGRRDELAGLLAQGEELAGELTAQAAGFRLAAEAAARRAADTNAEPAHRLAAEQHVRQSEDQSTALEGEAAEEGQLLESLREELVRTEERHAQLVRQRDVLTQRQRHAGKVIPLRVRLAMGGLLSFLAVAGLLLVVLARWRAGVAAEEDYRLGLAALRAQGRPYDAMAAFTSFGKASEAGHALAAGRLALWYFVGWHVAKDENRGRVLAAGAFAAIRKAAAGGDSEAATLLGLLYCHGVGVEVNDDEAVAWYRIAVEQNHPEAQTELGAMHAAGRGVVRNEKEAVAWYRKAAEQNFLVAEYHLGVAYALGFGMEKDEAEAVAWYRKAADRNLPDAKVRLGLMYRYGLGVAKDDEAAVYWYRHAAEQNNHPEAQVHLGLMYAQGLGVAKKDDEKAVHWLRKAADQNFPWGQYHLGERYALGLGVTKDDVKAVYWYHEAAKLNWAEGQNAMGMMSERGLGVKKDEEEAKRWYSKAAEQNYAPAVENLRRLTSK